MLRPSAAGPPPGQPASPSWGLGAVTASNGLEAVAPLRSDGESQKQCGFSALASDSEVGIYFLKCPFM